jgi:transglutaminase-like putative cysteine protease
MATAGGILNRNWLAVLIWLCVVLSSNSQERFIQREPGTRRDYANVFYNPQFTLFDFWSDEPIFPNNDGLYTIYTATEERKVPILLIGNAYTISKEIAYKFKNRSTCLNWCKNKTYNPNTIEEPDPNLNSDHVKDTAMFLSQDEIKKSETYKNTIPHDESEILKTQPDIQIPKVLEADLAQMDKIAEHTPANNDASMESLTAYFLKQTQNPILLARLLYTWIAIHINYDDEGFNTNHYASTDAASVFQNKKAVCAGYSNLFTSLATLMGIECVSINGYSKGYGSYEGERYTKSNHAWNAIKLNSTWHLIDATWGSGYGKTVNGSLKSIKKFDDYWFMTPPDAFIFSHYPENPEWCLTSVNIQKQSFEALTNEYTWLLKLGVDPTVVLTSALQNHQLKAPKVYSVDVPIRIQVAPIYYTLKEGLLHFTFQCKKPITLVAINDNETLEFTSNQDTYTLDFIAKPGHLKISIKLKPKDNKYWTLLEYYIK